MMPKKWKKSPPELVDALDKVLPNSKRVERRKMFGYPCAFSNDQLFIGLHQETMILRLPEEAKADFIKRYKSNIFSPFPGRLMKEYVVVPEKLYKKPAEMKKWIELSLDYVWTFNKSNKK